jgi:hypothetical protein
MCGGGDKGVRGLETVWCEPQTLLHSWLRTPHSLPRCDPRVKMLGRAHQNDIDGKPKRRQIDLHKICIVENLAGGGEG